MGNWCGFIGHDRLEESDSELNTQELKDERNRKIRIEKKRIHVDTSANLTLDENDSLKPLVNGSDSTLTESNSYQKISPKPETIPWLSEQDILSTKDRETFLNEIKSKAPSGKEYNPSTPESSIKKSTSKIAKRRKGTNLVVATDFSNNGVIKKQTIATPSLINIEEKKAPEGNPISDGYFTRSESRSFEKPMPTLKRRKRIKWKRGEQIGRGAFGTVWMALNETNGELMAVKEVELLNFTSKRNQVDIDALEKEIQILSALCHPNIVKYIGAERTETHMNIFLEYVSGGSISGLLQKFGKFTVSVVKIYTRQILQGLHFLHSRQIIHHDIKGANILCTASGSCKLADFGASRRLDMLHHNTNMSLRGTVLWMAPEVIRQTSLGRQCDIWSVGCTVNEMLTGKPPYFGFQTQTAAMFNIASLKEPPPAPVDSTGQSILKNDGIDFLKLCLQPEPLKRANANTLLHHPFIAVAKTHDSNPFNSALDTVNMCEVKKPKIHPSPRTSSKGFECILSASRHKITKKQIVFPAPGEVHRRARVRPRSTDKYKVAEETLIESPKSTDALIVKLQEENGEAITLHTHPPDEAIKKKHKKSRSRADMTKIKMELINRVENQIEETSDPDFKLTMVKTQTPKKNKRILAILKTLDIDDEKHDEADEALLGPIFERQSLLSKAGNAVIADSL